VLICHVAHDEVQLGAVEGRLAGLYRVVQAHVLAGFDDRRRGLLPAFRRAHVLVRLRVARADADAEVSHAQRVEDALDQVGHADELAQELLRRDEQVGVILREAAHIHAFPIRS